MAIITADAPASLVTTQDNVFVPPYWQYHLDTINGSSGNSGYQPAFSLPAITDFLTYYASNWRGQDPNAVSRALNFDLISRHVSANLPRESEAWSQFVQNFSAAISGQSYSR